MDPAMDQNYYRGFERANKELIEELLKFKKMEKEEKKEAFIEEAYKKIKTLAKKNEAAAVAMVPQERAEAMVPLLSLPKMPSPMPQAIPKAIPRAAPLSVAYAEGRKEEGESNIIQNLISLFRK